MRSTSGQTACTAPTVDAEARTGQNPLLSSQAIALARQSILDLDEGDSGAYVGNTLHDEHWVTHRFEANVPGYKGWEWAVVMADAPGQDPTVSEVTLQAGEDALQAPKWVPYEDRVRAGDLQPGDLLPPKIDDNRLEFDGDLESLSEFSQDGFARNPEAEEQLSADGMKDALARWSNGEFGPGSTYAQLAPAHCDSCAFYITLAQARSASRGDNSSREIVGVCTNEFSPADGHITLPEYGCGAHSSTKHSTTTRSDEDASEARG